MCLVCCLLLIIWNLGCCLVGCLGYFSIWLIWCWCGLGVGLGCLDCWGRIVLLSVIIVFWFWCGYWLFVWYWLLIYRCCLRWRCRLCWFVDLVWFWLFLGCWLWLWIIGCYWIWFFGYLVDGCIGGCWYWWWWILWCWCCGLFWLVVGCVVGGCVLVWEDFCKKEFYYIGLLVMMVWIGWLCCFCGGMFYGVVFLLWCVCIVNLNECLCVVWL